MAKRRRPRAPGSLSPVLVLRTGPGEYSQRHLGGLSNGAFDAGEFAVAVKLTGVFNAGDLIL